jgi:hypothetical protein
MSLTPEKKAQMLTALELAYFSGSMRVQYQDRSQTYRSLGEMAQLIDQLKVELGLKTGGARRSVVRTRRGLGGHTPGGTAI